jgi:hypothetical protein
MALVKYNNNSISSVTATAALASGAMTLIKSQTASSSANISFIHGTSDVVLDSTYPIYLFKFINIHPATDNTHFGVGFRDGSSAFDATKTTTMFYARHKEDDSGTGFAYETGNDIAQGTGYQNLYYDTGNGSDEAGSGELYLFNPSSTTYVKHFIATASSYGETPRNYHNFCSGYCNVTAAIDGVDFKMSSGNIDAGTFKLYGIKDS